MKSVKWFWSYGVTKGNSDSFLYTVYRWYCFPPTANLTELRPTERNWQLFQFVTRNFSSPLEIPARKITVEIVFSVPLWIQLRCLEFEVKNMYAKRKFSYIQKERTIDFFFAKMNFYTISKITNVKNKKKEMAKIWN